ncbi:MAG TPA: ABC transporter substrate-binding protein [Acidimicrobiales bacterium]|nr:ABC transporter substrate-binding protein [Acidimicrobiales bacterium]
MIAAGCGDDDGDTAADDPVDTTLAAADEADDEATDDDATDDEATDDEAAEPAGDPEPTAGFDGSTIRVGILVPKSGLPAIIGDPLATGQETYWSYVNEDLGGVAGRYTVEPVVEDTLYETNVTVQQYNRIKDDVVMFAQVMGTPHNLALLPLLGDDNIIVSPASQDSLWIREQQLFPILGPYQVDVINAMSFYIEEKGQPESVCAVIENDVYGEAGLAGLEFAGQEMGFEIATVARFAVGDQDFTGQVTQLRNSDCDVVLAVALPTEFGGILNKSAELNFTPQWIGQGPAWVDVLGLGDLRSYLEENVWIAASGPEWGDTSVPGMVAMLDHVERFQPDQAPTYYFTFGYFQAMAVHQLLEQAVSRGDLSREGMIEAMNSLDVLTFDGLVGDYGYGPPEEREPAIITTVFQVNMDRPFGLEAARTNFTSEVAERFPFD